jgi:Uri superfamily endonuclease
MSGCVTYQLQITLSAPCSIRVGRLGMFDFPAGRYIYTGSARRNLEARIARHQRADKKLRWHIDYLLASPRALVTGVARFAETECVVNQRSEGATLVPGFGASDCRAGCGSHLKFLGESLHG